MIDTAQAVTIADFALQLADPAVRAEFVQAVQAAGLGRDLAEALLVGGEEPPEELVLKLRRPIEHASTTYAEVKLREPIADEMIKIAGKTGVERIAELVFVQSGMPLGAVKKLAQRDLNKVAEYYDLFS